MRVAVVIPVYNEENSIASLLNVLTVQTKTINEIIVVDGGSTDKTLFIVESYRNEHANIKFIKADRIFPGKGRNVGVRSTSCDIIIFCDAGCIPEKNWVEEMTKPFHQDDDTEVVYGSLRPAPKTLISKVITALTFSITTWPYVTCMALKKNVWETIGGFPEMMRTAEDLIFIDKIEKGTFRIVYNMHAINHWEPRSSFKAFATQYYSYAYGSGRNNIQCVFFLRKTIFYIIICICTIGAFKNAPFFVVGILMYMSWCILAIKSHYQWFVDIAGDVRVYFLIPLIVLIRDISAILGYWKGRADNFIKKRR